MNAEVKQRMSEASTSVSVGVGGIALASFLIALLTWFPSSSMGQPLWLLGCLEIAASLMFAWFGLRHFWLAAPRVTSSAWDVDGINLYPYVKSASYHSFAFRAQIYANLCLALNAPINWPKEFVIEAGFIKILLAILFLLLLRSDSTKNKVPEREYKRIVPEELQKETKRLIKKTTIPVLSSAIFQIVMLIIYVFDTGKEGRVEQSLSGFLVVAALIPLAIHLVYARRISRQEQRLNNLRIEGEQIQ